MNVRQVMSTPAITISPDATVAELARQLLSRGLSGLPVVGVDGRMLGLVTKNDVVGKHAQVHLPTYFAILGGIIPFQSRHTDQDVRRALAVTARDLMETDVVTVGPDETIDEAAARMVEHRANPLPVIENGHLVGVIGHDDIIRVLLVEEEDGEDEGRSAGQQ